MLLPALAPGIWNRFEQSIPTIVPGGRRPTFHAQPGGGRLQLRILTWTLPESEVFTHKELVLLPERHAKEMLVSEEDTVELPLAGNCIRRVDLPEVSDHPEETH